MTIDIREEILKAAKTSRASGDPMSIDELANLAERINNQHKEEIIALKRSLVKVKDQIENLKACIGAGAIYGEAVDILAKIDSDKGELIIKTSSDCIGRVAGKGINDIDIDVITKAYGWTLSAEGEVLGLIAGDMGYERTGIRLDEYRHEKEL